MQYLNEKKKLKTMLYQVKKAFLDKKLNKLGKLVYTSPSLFWSAIKILHSDTKQKANCVPPRILKQHFEKLLASRIRKANPHFGPLANSKVDIPFSTEEL